MTAALAATAGLWAMLAVVRYLPTHDGPHHVFLTHLENHYSDPGAAYPDYYVPSRALSSAGFSLLFAPLSELFAWRPALQTTLAVIVATWAWGATALAGAVHPRRAVLGAVGFATAFQWALYMGFFSYLLSSAVGMFTLALAVRVESWRWKHREMLTGLLLVQAIFHVFGAEVVGMVLVLLVAFREPLRRWPRELALLALSGLPAGYVAAYAAGIVGVQTVAMPAYSESSTWLPFTERVTLLADAFAAGPAWRAWPPVALGLAGLGFGARRSFAGRAAPHEKALLASSLILLGAALATPFSMPKWEFLSPRFVPMAFMLCIPLIPLEAVSSTRVTRAIALGLGAHAAAATLWAGWHHRRLERACGPALAALNAPIERRGPRLPIILDTTCSRSTAAPPFAVRFAEPAWNTGLLYAAQQGGIVPYAFTGIPQLHSFVMTVDGDARIPEIPNRIQLWGALMRDSTPPETREAMLTELAAAGAHYEDIIFYGPEADRAAIAARGWKTDWLRDGLWIARFEGCPARATVSFGAPAGQPMLIELGWHPNDTPEHRALVRPLPDGGWSTVVMRRKRRAPGGLDLSVRGVGSGDGRDRVRVDAMWHDAPCGKTWIRAGRQLDGSGDSGAAGGACAGADAEGRLVTTLSSEQRALTCDVEGPATPR